MCKRWFIIAFADWLWFKAYLLPSALFHEEIPSNISIPENETKIDQDNKIGDEGNKSKKQNQNDQLLYVELVKIVQQQLQLQIDHLQEPIDRLENTTDPEMKQAWEQLKNYPEFMVWFIYYSINRTVLCSPGYGVMCIFCPCL